jgi:hypothetical protein
MRTSVFLSALVLLGALTCVSAFAQKQVTTQFLDSQPHPKIRVDFDLPGPAFGPGSVTATIVADVGYFFDYTNKKPVQHYLASAPAYLRNVKVWLKSPSGDKDIYLGTFFDGNTNNNQVNYVAEEYFFYMKQKQFYPYQNNYDNGYYNALNVIKFYFPADIWEPIVSEGLVSFIFEFSDEVNSYYLRYPYSDILLPYYPENFLSVYLDYTEAAVLGDPHFFGWNGEKFDFQGENHHIYNLVSHKDTQVNFQMKQRNFFSVTSLEELESLKHNTYIGSMGIKTKAHQLVLFSGESGFTDAGYIELDGVKHNPVRGNSLLFSDSELTVEWVEPQNDLLLDRDPIAALLEVTAGIFKFRVYFIEHGRNVDTKEWHSHPFRFFDLYASIKEEPHIRGRIHGVLGQTGDKFLSLKPAGQEQWNIEGTFEDYKVSDLFGSDFKFSLFSH